MTTWEPICTYRLCKNVWIFRLLALYTAGQYWRGTLSSGKETWVYSWFLAILITTGFKSMVLTGPSGFLQYHLWDFSFSCLSQRHDKHLSQWCISLRLLRCSFLNFLEDLLASYFLFHLWQSSKKQTMPYTTKAKSASQTAAAQTHIAKFPDSQTKGLGMPQCLHVCVADTWKLWTWQVHKPWIGATRVHTHQLTSKTTWMMLLQHHQQGEFAGTSLYFALWF